MSWNQVAWWTPSWGTQGMGWAINISEDSRVAGKEPEGPKWCISWTGGKGQEGQLCLISASIKNITVQDLQEEEDSVWFFRALGKQLEKSVNVLIQTRTDAESKKLNMSPVCTLKISLTILLLFGHSFLDSLPIHLHFLLGTHEKAAMPQDPLDTKSSRKHLKCAAYCITHLTHGHGIIPRCNRAAPHGIRAQSKQLIFLVLNI